MSKVHSEKGKRKTDIEDDRNSSRTRSSMHVLKEGRQEKKKGTGGRRKGGE